MEELTYQPIYKLPEGKYYVSISSFQKMVKESEEQLVILLDDPAVNIATNNYNIPIRVISSFPATELEYNEDILSKYDLDDYEEYMNMSYTVLDPLYNSYEGFDEELLSIKEVLSEEELELYNSAKNIIQYILPKDDDPSRDKFYEEAWDEFSSYLKNNISIWKWSEIKEILTKLFYESKKNGEEMLREFQSKEGIKSYIEQEDDDEQDDDIEYYNRDEFEILESKLEFIYVTILMNINDPETLDPDKKTYLKEYEVKMGKNDDYDTAEKIYCYFQACKN